MSNRPGTPGGVPNRGTTIEGAVVVTVTVIAVGAVGFNVTTPGLTPQVDSRGAPAQVRDTDWLKPPPEASDSE